MGHLNIAGWTPSNSELRNKIFTNENCDVYSLCETHLSENSDFAPKVNGYKLIRHDRLFVHRKAPKTWGGVGFLVREDILQSYECHTVDKGHEGILLVELIHRSIGTRLLFISCYLPPECSPHGRNSSEFYDYLTSICYSKLSEYDRVILCGDINARIGHSADTCTDIDIELPKRVVLDEKDNNHGKGYIEFLNENKLCVLNGRFDPSFDNFTSITGRGKSVVDYIFCPHDQFGYFSDFKVITCKEIANKYSLQHLIGEKSKLPDHALLKVNLCVVSVMNENIDTKHKDHSSMPSVTYKVSNIPDSFMNTDTVRQE